MRTSEMLLFDEEFSKKLHDKKPITDEESNQVVRETLMLVAEALQDVSKEISEIKKDLSLLSQED